MKKNNFYRKALITLFVLCLIAGWSGCKIDNDPNKNNTKDTSGSKYKNDVLNQKVLVEIKSKDFQHGDPRDPNDSKDYNVLIYNLINKTNKSIHQIEADVIVNDPSGNEIKKISISFIEGVPASGSKEYKGLYNFNAFNEKDVSFKNADLNNLRFDINIIRIGYQDGTFEIGK